MTTEESPWSGKAYLDAMTAMSAAMHQQTMQAMSRAEEAVAEVFDAWAQSTRRLTAAPPPGTVEQLLKPSEMIDRGFDLAEQLLKAQHSLARTLLGAVEQQLVETAGAASTKAATDDTGDSGGLRQAIKNAFRGTSEEETRS
ncbi:MAG: hypothetical protein M3P83_13170 [Actinomycetota bacterium]|nr:hypothetical protein [Actinomycetota bacterium]